MRSIRTVLADISPPAIFSHCHEHLWIKRGAPDDCPVSPIDAVRPRKQSFTPSIAAAGGFWSTPSRSARAAILTC